MSRQFQITLPDDLAAELKREAARLQIPLSEFIREAMREKLANRPPPMDVHPFESILGIVQDGEPDLSDRVDEILYRQTNPGADGNASRRFAGKTPDDT